MAITERYLTQIVNYSIDVNRFVFHLAQVTAPENYYDTFVELGRLKILPMRLAKQLVPCIISFPTITTPKLSVFCAPYRRITYETGY